MPAAIIGAVISTGAAWAAAAIADITFTSAMAVHALTTYLPDLSPQDDEA